MVTKLRQFKKLKCREGSRKNSSILNCPDFVTIFLEFWNFKYFFLKALAILLPSPSRIHWPINFTKKIEVSGYFQKKIKNTSLNRVIHPADSWPYVVSSCLNSNFSLYLQFSPSLKRFLGLLRHVLLLHFFSQSSVGWKKTYICLCI